MGLFVAQLLTGLANAATLFLVASGLSLIFGVTRIVNFSLKNAFHDSTASIKQVKLGTFDCTPGVESHKLPIGQVGVIAADKDDLPNCIDEIVEHYDHYRETALAFSNQWYSQHDPNRTVKHLVSAGQSVTPSLRRVA